VTDPTNFDFGGRRQAAVKGEGTIQRLPSAPRVGAKVRITEDCSSAYRANSVATEKSSLTRLQPDGNRSYLHELRLPP